MRLCWNDITFSSSLQHESQISTTPCSQICHLLCNFWLPQQKSTRMPTWGETLTNTICSVNELCVNAASSPSASFSQWWLCVSVCACVLSGTPGSSLLLLQSRPSGIGVVKHCFCLTKHFNFMHTKTHTHTEQTYTHTQSFSVLQQLPPCTGRFHHAEFLCNRSITPLCLLTVFLV